MQIVTPPPECLPVPSQCPSDTGSSTAPLSGLSLPRCRGSATSGGLPRVGGQVTEPEVKSITKGRFVTTEGAR